MLRSIQETEQTETGLSSGTARDVWGRSLEEALLQDQLARAARWDRKARRVSQLFDAFWPACILLWIGSAAGILLRAYASYGDNLAPDRQMYVLFGTFFLAQWVLPHLGEWQLPPIRRRWIERVIADAHAEGIELNPEDYP